MIQAWNQCEIQYPFIPHEVLEAADSARATLPSRYCDPKVVAQLYDEVLEEYELCDELGLNIVVTEHHSGPNNLCATSPLIGSIAARLTKKVRILSMGTLVTIRPDPVRVANEYATIDCLSKGRLVVGFVKSGQSELLSGDANPMGLRERQWEAIDVIEKALTSHDGPFSWEGKHYTHSCANIWPRPYQSPRPPFWMATNDMNTTKEAARRGMTIMSLFGDNTFCRASRVAYRQAAGEVGQPVNENCFGHANFSFVADTDEEAIRLAEKCMWHVQVGIKEAPQMLKFIPGRDTPEAKVRNWRDGSGGAWRSRATVEDMVRKGLVFCGSPDTFVQQVKDYREYTGGLGHFVFHSRAGFVSHAEHVKHLKLLAKEVMPQLQDLSPIDEERFQKQAMAVAG